MNADILGGLVRHLITALGSYWATQGLIGKDQLEAFAGGASVTAAILWSVWHKQGLKNDPTPPNCIKLMVLCLAASLPLGCTHVSTKVTHSMEAHPGQTNVITDTTKTSAYSFFDSAQKIERAMAKQTKTGQSAGFDGLDQSASSTNLNSLVESIASGIVKGIKP
jgi:hypothetical protein